MADSPRIYVACLAAYNAGKLHGVWIDADQSVDDLNEAVQQMLARSPKPGAEEWAIHDYENFGDVTIGEHESLELVSELARFLSEHDGVGAAAYNHFGDLDEARRAMAEQYQGTWSSLADWAEEFLKDSGQLSNVPDALLPYVDFEKYADDLELSGDIFSIELDSRVHVFWAH